MEAIVLSTDTVIWQHCCRACTNVLSQYQTVTRLLGFEFKKPQFPQVWYTTTLVWGYLRICGSLSLRKSISSNHSILCWVVYQTHWLLPAGVVSSGCLALLFHGLCINIVCCPWMCAACECHCLVDPVNNTHTDLPSHMFVEHGPDCRIKTWNSEVSSCVIKSQERTPVRHQENPIASPWPMCKAMRGHAGPCAKEDQRHVSSDLAREVPWWFHWSQDPGSCPGDGADSFKMQWRKWCSLQMVDRQCDKIWAA